jgi:hypothetical protein
MKADQTEPAKIKKARKKLQGEMITRKQVQNPETFIGHQ